MGNKLYVGNVSFAATAETLSTYFSNAGTVEDVQLMIDKVTGRSRGFAFVTMGSDAEAQAAINQLHGQPFEGRNLSVSEARPREERPAAAPRERRSFSGDAGGGGPGRGFPAGRAAGGHREPRGGAYERDRGRERGRDFERGERQPRRDRDEGRNRRDFDME